MEIPGYRDLREIFRGPSFAFANAVRDQNGEAVLLKIREVGNVYAEKEHTLFSDLDLACIPKPIEFLASQGRKISVLEPFEGRPVVPPLDISDFLAVASSLARTIAGLHRSGVAAGVIDAEAVLFDPTTKEILLADLSYSFRGPDKNGSHEHGIPEGLPLGYISPEMTGRIDGSVDDRSDLYSLGTVLYHFLFGRPPFIEQDPLELIHKHIASVPEELRNIHPDSPVQLTRIVAKLLEKQPDKRYQSAEGLLEDLERCARSLASYDSIPEFEPGTHDISDRFRLPDTLYGRQTEIGKLSEIFEQISDGPPAMLLVAGYPGIGKTSLIKQFGAEASRRGGIFVEGKFDLVARGVPFSALIQAIGSLVGDLLTLDDDVLAAKREKIALALGGTGGVLTEVVPELELLIGDQPSAPGLGPRETLNRLQLVFQRFLSAVSTSENPLVVFLDDLQWADAATLDLILPLLSGSSSARHFVLVGAYRDNEIGVTHPLARTISELEASGVSLHKITLGPLEMEDLVRFVSDSLRTGEEQSQELAGIVQEKTAGNPFFVLQFLSTLNQEGLLRFDREARRWTYDREAIAEAGLADNVIDLMTRKIARLPSDTGRMLQLASSIGSRFSLEMLSTISGEKASEVERALSEAIEAGLVVRHPGMTENDPGFSFLHDRVQQAAQDLMSDEKRAMVHLTVGRLLMSTLSREKADEELFDIVNHLNLGKDLITDSDENERLAELNLRAGTKARASAAFDSALAFFRTGSEILEGSRRYELDFELRLGASECGYLCGDLDEDGIATEALLSFARSDLDRARVLNLKMLRFENQGMYREAVGTALECLSLFGFSFPRSDSDKAAKLNEEISEIERLISGRPIGELVDLPEMTDPSMKMVLNILTDIWSSTYITGDEVLARLISATIVRITLTHGCAAASAYGYVTHAITVGPVLGDYESALEFGKLALKVNEKFEDARRRAKVHQQFHAHVALWRLPFRLCAEHAREAARSGLEAGDFLYASYGTMTETWSAYQIADDLEEFSRSYAPGLDLIQKLKVGSFADAHNLMLNRALALCGKTESPVSVTAGDFSEEQYARAYADNPFFSTFLSVSKLELYYTFGEYDNALTEYRRAIPLVSHVSGTIWPVLLDTWGGLTLAANALEREGDERDPLIAEAADASQRLEILAENCPQNYLVPSLLLKASIAVASGLDAESLVHFENAVKYSERSGATRDRALANELFGKYWLARGNDVLAGACLRESLNQYTRFKASAKCAELRQCFPFLASSSGMSESRLDAASVIKAAQALSVEIDLEQLVGDLLKIVAENAGAERAVLFVDNGGRLEAVAERSEAGPTTMLDSPIDLRDTDTVPHSILNYVQRTNEEVVVESRGTGTRYESDPYFTRVQPQSAMAVPLIGRGSLKGILYLENRVTKGAFSAERVSVCRVLASQVAIPLENASLYHGMRIEADQRRQAEETLRSITEGTASVTGGSFFSSLVRHLADAFGVGFALITEFRPDTGEAEMLAFWKRDELAETSSYEVKGTPCEKVLTGETCFYSEGVQKRFPKDQDLVEIGAVGYWGIPLRSMEGSVIGHLAVLDDGPLEESELGKSLLSIFAARAGAELERLRAERGLQSALAEVKALKDRLQDENVYLRDEIRQSHNFEEIVGESPALLKTLQDVAQVAPTDATVLVTGETGTGKELIARAVHERSKRKNRPLVKVNCAAISAGLVESELFGHTKGAFTGAVEKRSGRFELADGGTIFLDEVGELPPETQVKILRVLQEGEFEPVGSSKTVKVDVRVIAATNRDLEDEVRSGRFRSDLYFRLNVFPVAVPPLRDRLEDLPALVTFFLDRFSKAFGRNIKSVPQGVLRMLSEYDWPGNIRELQNLIERAVVLAPTELESLSAELIPVGSGAEQIRAAAAPASTSGSIRSSSDSAGASMEEIERTHILNVLESTGWVIGGTSGAASVLDLHPNTLRSRMKKLGIRRPS
ncbi:MAG: GAF domain-containing protein [Acidobacteria bacterium]|nr:MAG: GAF domain-containing protein [Acidobacteriota bacterium]REJ97953.1 MAG: GAF domain-containing protein [Acidobacteriota bacterium]REK16696.1 MAG: GAF domain-containing protein [Acidobacteriota bacterium]REK42607.1 MAG: GAF domain-containing protein [Acidobacteriota bacterium]